MKASTTNLTSKTDTPSTTELTKHEENEVIIRDQALALIKEGDGTIVSCQASMEDAISLARVIKAYSKKVDDVRTSLVKPLNDQVKDINFRFKNQIVDKLDVAEGGLKKKMLTYSQEQERIARKEAEDRKKEEEAERAVAAMIAEDMGEAAPEVVAAPAVEAVSIPKVIRTDTGAAAFMKKTWTFEVQDIAKLAEARPDLVEVITSKVNEAIRGGHRDLPGLRIYQQESMAVR